MPSAGRAGYNAKGMEKKNNQPNKLVPPNQPVASSCCVDNSVQCHVSKYFSYSRPLPDIRRIVEPRQDPRSPFAYLSCYIYISLCLSLSLWAGSARLKDETGAVHVLHQPAKHQLLLGCHGLFFLNGCGQKEFA